jgi:hypothetical protein
MNYLAYLVLATLSSAFPYVVSAADVTIVTIFKAFSLSLSRVSGLLVAVALVVFLWGVVTFIMNAGDEKARSEGRVRIIWGLVGLAIIVTMWGIVNLIRITAGTQNIPACNSPHIDITTGKMTNVECL